MEARRNSSSKDFVPASLLCTASICICISKCKFNAVNVFFLLKSQKTSNKANKETGSWSRSHAPAKRRREDSLPAIGRKEGLMHSGAVWPDWGHFGPTGCEKRASYWYTAERRRFFSKLTLQQMTPNLGLFFLGCRSFLATLCCRKGAESGHTGSKKGRRKSKR